MDLTVYSRMIKTMIGHDQQVKFLTGQVTMILAGYCPLTSHYFEPSVEGVLNAGAPNTEPRNASLLATNEY